MESGKKVKPLSGIPPKWENVCVKNSNCVWDNVCKNVFVKKEDHGRDHSHGR